jgi:hypothetical protein
MKMILRLTYAIIIPACFQNLRCIEITWMSYRMSVRIEIRIDVGDVHVVPICFVAFINCSRGPVRNV